LMCGGRGLRRYAEALELYLENNAALTDLQLGSLRHVDAAWVSAQQALTTLSLPSLTAITHTLDVLDNPALQALSLPALVAVGEARVRGNPLLDVCAVEAELAGVGAVEVEPACMR
jgi:hypothetical protein